MTSTSDDIIPGVCQICGCTDERACAGGCSWVDDERTLCSACAENQAAEFLEDDSQVDQLTELLERAQAEAQELGMVALDIDADVLLTLILAAKASANDPTFPEESRPLIDRAVGQALEMFRDRDCPAAVEVLEGISS